MTGKTFLGLAAGTAALLWLFGGNNNTTTEVVYVEPQPNLIQDNIPALTPGSADPVPTNTFYNPTNTTPTNGTTRV